MGYKLLVINPGSTSTKIAVYDDNKEVFEETLRHQAEEIAKYDTIPDQLYFRKGLILDVLKKNNFDISTLNAVVGRGGMLKPIEGGTYEVNPMMVEDLRIGVQGPHASNLGGILAREIADSVGGRAFIVDPVVVDELSEIARVSGCPDIPRKSKFHALNQKAVAKRFAKEVGKNYEDLNLIVVHMGGGVSVGAHKNGKVVDVNNALDGDGPFSPERAGAVPVGDLIKLCFSGKFSEKEVYSKIVGNGGYVAYLGLNDQREVQNRIAEGDKKAETIYNAFMYQICNAIGEKAVVLEGKVDGIILTGGIAYSEMVVDQIKAKTGWISKITVYPGEDEMLALAEGALRVLNGEEAAKNYA
ncbi:MAG: butyrate kinase [Sarcina sp.]